MAAQVHLPRDVLGPRRVVAVAVLADALAVGSRDAVDQVLRQAVGRRHVERELVPVCARRVVLWHEQAVVDPELRVGVWALHLAEAHPDQHLLDALCGLAQDVDPTALDVGGVGLDVVGTELDVAPLAGGQQVGRQPVDRLGGLDALHQRRHARVSERQRPHGPLVALREAALDQPRERRLGGVLAGCDGVERRRLRVGVRVGVGVRVDRAGVDGAVLLSREVRQRDLDGLAVETGGVCGVADRDRTVVSVSRRTVEAQLRQAGVAVALALVGEPVGHALALAHRHQALVTQVERRARDRLGLQPRLFGDRGDRPLVGRGHRFEHRDL
ncbi:MAG: hypothetical protein A07HB70_01082 [uncultured archaeon A07HB70]|nr:MAG: hypothetical protein A07HB70_01082 [uncultured archaeon A07HB70]